VPDKKAAPLAKFSIQAGALRDAIARSGQVTERRNTIPILAHLHLAATAGALTVRGTDLEVSITVQAKGDGDLAPITASAARLAALLTHVPDEQTVTLAQAKEGQLEMETGAMRAKLYTIPPEDFPTPGEQDWKARWSAPAGDLRGLIDKTMHAISTEETRYYLNGIFLHTEPAEGGPKLRATTTDGHRLMIADVATPAGDEPISMIVPRKTAHLLRGLLAQLPPGRVVDVRQTEARLEVTASSWTLNSKVIDGTFPNYRRVIPAEEGEILQVLDARRMVEAIQSVAAISSERSRPVKFTNGSGSAVSLHCTGPEQGEAYLDVESVIAAWRSNGQHPEFGVQARYLLDILRVFRGPEGFTMRMKDGSSPIRVTGAEGMAVLMPMRV
jgi:DNA polymerase-3 subunit beta